MGARTWMCMTWLALAACSASAAPGSLDPLFAGGKVVTQFGPSQPSGANALAMQANGHVVLGGSSHDGTTTRFALARYTPLGALDATFGNAGKVVSTIPGTISGLAIAADGSIVALGLDCKVARFTAAGALDPLFGTAGVATIDSCLRATGVALDDLGRIVVIADKVATYPATHVVLFRLTPAGAPDLAFNSTGNATVAFTNGTSGSNTFTQFIKEEARAVAIGSSGKIVALSYELDATAIVRQTIRLARFKTDGTPDTSFGSGGFVSTNPSPGSIDFGGPIDLGEALAIDATDRVVVAGSANTQLSGHPDNMLVLRYTSSGALDTSFNGSGHAVRAIGTGASIARSVAIQEDGKIVAAGESSNGTRREFTVVRYLATGAPDPGFGAGGLVTIGFDGHADARAVVLGTLDLGGHILVAGSAVVPPTSFALVALEGDDPPRMYGLSTRMQVLTGEDVAIGGFIIGGSAPKKVMVRARGPSLGIAGALADPVLTLVPAAGGPITVNDDWQLDANAAALAATGYNPSLPQEAALLRELAPGAYTAIVTGAGGTIGLAIVEIYEVDSPDAPLVGISTRGRVGTGDNVMIGGFIIEGDGPQTVVVRSRGPSLGVAGALADTVLTLVPGFGGPILANDDWQTDAAAAALAASGYQPGDPKESALMLTLNPGPYTAIVSGAGGSTGVAIVEVYKIVP
jgi:uncharacterized delta-60 repeat protein